MSRAQRIWIEWAILVIALMVPAGAHALGLGEARVESFLNQPLDVRMRLLDASPDDLDSLSVSLASPEDFERLGLTSDALALNLDVRIDRSGTPAVVRVTSRRPVSDPVVQLLVDARWANGRVLREYTLFLDPATVEVEAPSTASTPTEQPADPAPSESRRAPPPAERDAPARPGAETRETRPAAAVSGTGRYGPVASGETLWSIARAHLPAGDVTMDQMMIAIVELNPNAFRDNNVNRLLRGAELEMPDARRARQLDAGAARAAVLAQNRAFRRRMEADPPVVSSAGRETGAGQDTGRAGDTSDSADAAADHRLSLVPPGDEESGEGLSGDAADVENLQQRLARAEEELYAARQETEDFQSRVEELEALVRDNPGGLGIRDAELAGLEETLRQAREATREDADPELRATVSERLDEYLEQYGGASQDAAGPGDSAGELAAAASDEDAAGPAGEATDESAAGDGQSTAPAGETPATAEPEPTHSVTDVGGSGGLLSNPFVLVGIGLLVLAGLGAGGWFALRARRESAVERRPRLNRASEMPTPTRAPESPIDAARARVAADPEDLSAHAALLETLSTDGNEGAFGDALESMFEHVESGDEPEWRHALELAGRIVPGHLLVKGSSDWVAESETPTREPASELDEESEVDDLMSRLDADLDESDDSEWLGETGAAESEEPEGPLLRGNEDDSDDEPPQDITQRPGPKDDETAGIDMGELGEPSDQAEAPEDEPAGESTEGDDLLLDWPDAEDESTGARREPGGEAGGEPAESDAERGPAEESASGEDRDADDDIFAPSDDDVDVKLDLAKAYLSWNSADSAKTLLEEITREGNDAQREEARRLLDDLSDESDR